LLRLPEIEYYKPPGDLVSALEKIEPRALAREKLRREAGRLAVLGILLAAGVIVVGGVIIGIERLARGPLGLRTRTVPLGPPTVPGPAFVGEDRRLSAAQGAGRGDRPE